MTVITATNARTITAAAITADADADGFLTVAELATLIGRTPRRIRRDFRAAGVTVGHGGVWAIPVTEVALYV